MSTFKSRSIVARAIGVTAAALVVVAVPGAAGSPAVADTGTTGFTVVDLGTLVPDGVSEATAVNDRGLVVGNSQAADGYLHAVAWRNGKIIDLGESGVMSGATDVNNRGDIVGFTGDPPRAALWRGGRLTDLGAVLGESYPKAISDRGEIVGTLAGPRAFSWRDGVVTLLETPGLWSTGDGVNDRGDVVGQVAVDGANSVPALWRNGRRLQQLTEGYGMATAVNDRRQVTGHNFGSESFVWSAGHVTRIVPPSPDLTLQAQDINNRGQVVGTESFGGFLWERGVVTLLPGLDQQGTVAAGINDHGVIVGFSLTAAPTGIWHAILLTPVRPAISVDGRFVVRPLADRAEGPPVPGAL